MYPNIAILCAGDGRACLTSHRTYGSYIILVYICCTSPLSHARYKQYLARTAIPGNNYYTAVTIVTIDSFGLVGVLTRRAFQLF